MTVSEDPVAATSRPSRLSGTALLSARERPPMDTGASGAFAAFKAPLWEYLLAISHTRH
jgi:hypothetical protein